MRIIVLVVSIASLLNSSDGTTSSLLFDSDFRTPEPPTLIAEYQANFVQHKWDSTGVSHIVSGTIYANLAVGRLRMDITHGGIIASSLFDYTVSNPDGTILNTM